MKKIIRLGIAVAVMSVMLPWGAAHAGVAVGAGAACDTGNPEFCVTTQVAGAGAGTTVTKGEFVGVCEAESTGALIVTVTCSAEGHSSTTSLPGPYGAAAVVAPTGTLTGHQVCWNTTAYFTNPLGGVVVVNDTGCGIVDL